MINVLVNLVFIIQSANCRSPESVNVTHNCAVNEEYDPCGPTCAQTCIYPEAPPLCTEQCLPGCFCRAGYLRDHNGSCIEKHLCAEVKPEDCGQNEEFLECGSQCVATCARPDPPENCTLACTKGCFCREGFLRDTYSGQCVDATSCSENCLYEYEEFSSCYFQCQPTCLDKEPLCAQNCVAGCVCAQSLIRDLDWKCVAPDECQTNNATSNFNGDLLAPLWRILHRLLLS